MNMNVVDKFMISHFKCFQDFIVYTSKLLKSVHFDQVNKELKCRHRYFSETQFTRAGWLVGVEFNAPLDTI